MAIERASVSVCTAPSVTLAVNVETPAVVGVPLMTPVEGFSVRPAGSAPESSDHV